MQIKRGLWSNINFKVLNMKYELKHAGIENHKISTLFTRCYFSQVAPIYSSFRIWEQNFYLYLMFSK